MHEMLNKIILGDCLDVMRGMPDKCVDLVLTDPPYGINIDIIQANRVGRKNGKSGGQYKSYHSTNWDSAIPCKEYFDEIFRVSKNQIIFGGEYMTEYLPPNKAWIIWDKIARSFLPDGEMAWTSFKKGLKIYQYSRADAYINKVGNKIHPTQKPLDLFSWIIRDYSKENDIIFDPFIGSGTTAIACIANNRQFIGIEKDPEYHRLATERVEKEKLNLFN